MSVRDRNRQGREGDQQDVREPGSLHPRFGRLIRFAGLPDPRALGVIPGSIVRRRLSWAEAIDQAWFLVSVSLLPTLLIALPFGLVLVRVAPNTEVGSLANQIGAPSFVGAVDAVGTVREAAPIITAIVLAGAGGSAIAADLGACSDHGRHPRHQ